MATPSTPKRRKDSENSSVSSSQSASKTAQGHSVSKSISTPFIETLIVGGGFSGIACAARLHTRKKEFHVLEARDRLGGRVYTRRYKNGLYLDLGGQWIGPGQDRMYEICYEHGIEIFETYNQGYHILDFGGKLRKFQGLIPRLGIPSLLNLHFVLQRLENLARQIRLESPWEHPSAGKWDKITLGSYLEKVCLTQDCLKITSLALETVFACDLSEISLLHALFYFRSGRDLNTLINIQDGAQQHRIVGGMQTIIEKMAEPFLNRIRFLSPVKRVVREKKKLRVEGEGFSFICKNLVLAIPPTLIAGIEFQPMLSSAKRQIVSRIAMGQVGKCFLVYESPFWREEGFSGQAFSDENSPFQSMFDSSPKDAKYGILLGFTIGKRARYYFRQDPSARKQVMLSFAKRYFGEKASRPVLYEDFTMTEEPYSRGCYAGLYSTGVWTGYGSCYRMEEDGIYFAGTEASPVWFGYIEGAVRAGEEIAGKI